MASGAYAARLHGLLQARANALGLEDVSGSVGVSFTVSREGRLTGSIVRPSGNFEIDSALRSMLRGFSVPPPPGGGFSGAVTIRVR